jgi:hypothetical protein
MFYALSLVSYCMAVNIENGKSKVGWGAEKGGRVVKEYIYQKP